jgi:hypothetical protein
MGFLYIRIKVLASYNANTLISGLANKLFLSCKNFEKLPVSINSSSKWFGFCTAIHQFSKKAFLCPHGRFFDKNTTDQGGFL